MTERRPARSWTTSKRVSPAAKRLLDRCTGELDEALAGVSSRDADLFLTRLTHWFQLLLDGLHPVYGHRDDFDAFVRRLVLAMARCQSGRPEPLKLLDVERDLDRGWFQNPAMLGYSCYAEQFAGTLAGVTERLDYLESLGVTYLHLMKVMHARDGENDGGYAIVDYDRVDPLLGDNDDLVALCSAMRARGMSLCIDLVLNHCAREHPWAAAARRGESPYVDYFYLFDDRGMPDAYERTLPEVFPDFAPGNFTFDETSGKWVWTTFHDYQWDLNWTNPAVFLEIAEVMFRLANLGVEVLRLDAVAFMWKRLGTNSQNQEEVFDLLQAIRTCARIATPAVAHKAEAIVSPDDLIRYFGVGHRHGKVSNLAYHNSLMVQYWGALASRDTRLMTHALSEFPRTPASIAWATYIRCHDDIGWAIADDDAAAVGLGGASHRHFLSDFYAGEFPGSFARGGVFQHNPATDDRRINGSFASLAGIEAALESNDTEALDLAIERLLLGHALIAGFGGLPLIYMGDEIALPNDYDYAADPDHAHDSRWMHRPRMDWARAERRHEPGTVEARVFEGTRHIMRVRAATPQFDAVYDTDVLDTGHPRVFVVIHRHPLANLAAVYNMTDDTQYLRLDALTWTGIAGLYDRLSARTLEPVDEHLVLAPYARHWVF